MTRQRPRTSHGVSDGSVPTLGVTTSHSPERSASHVTEEVAAFVLERDRGCMAPRLGGSSLDCWGRDRLEHVKDEPRMGRRAPSDAGHLVTLCQGHTEDGMRAGYVWATDRVNRERMREYLDRVNDLKIYQPWRDESGYQVARYGDHRDPLTGKDNPESWRTDPLTGERF